MNFTETLTEQDLDITIAAQNKLIEILCGYDDCNDKAIRIYIAGGGCGGVTYGMSFAERADQSDKDTVLCVTRSNFEGFQVFVDVIALEYLRGAQIDFITAIGQERFVFNDVFQNTGGTGGCTGCGGAQ